ncbi:MAG: hypothetical protein BWY65_00282 [Firmicutes bacterium ADurb.Bin373]|nr:MAG: hypothetical protein BWY65_00282 [Firmicutes bacterium ADurb.Bin373]
MNWGQENGNSSKNFIEGEKETLRKMITLYCRKQHHGAEVPCAGCRDLFSYACKRLDLCKFGAGKPSCKKCPVHCYKPGQRKEVKKIMRYAGPRMIIYHPLEAIRHIIKNKKYPL